MRALAALALLTLAACSPKTAAPALPALDCAKGFEALSNEIAASPALTAAPKEPGEPYRFYSAADGQASFMVTEPGAPGHPAILEQTTAGGQLANTGCPFGDKAGYTQLVAYLKSLHAAGK